MLRTPIFLSETQDSPWPFTPAIRCGEFVFVSGQASVDAHGTILNGSFEEEMRRSMDNVQAILRAAGCDLGDAVLVRAYVHDAADVPQFNELYRDYFARPFPARTTLTNCLAQVKFEIDVIAAVPGTED